MSRVVSRKEENDNEMKNFNIDVLVMDPPRSGSTPEFIKAVSELKIGRIVYVSCNPETLARDLKEFRKKRYKVEKITPVDMFPQTVHVETVVCLSQQKPDDYIEIEIDLDEIDATSAETKATHKEIQNWVQEHHGFHMTNLNIAQVKQKHGSTQTGEWQICVDCIQKCTGIQGRKCRRRE